MIDPLDPTLTANVPEIGKKVESIPVERVMMAMESLETELKEFYVSQAMDLEDAIQRVRDLGNEECECLNYTSGCEHDGIQRAIKALDGEK